MVHFGSKPVPQFDSKMGHVNTNNGIANAQRYQRGHSKQVLVSVGVFCSSRLCGSTEFCALIILSTEVTLDQPGSSRYGKISPRFDIYKYCHNLLIFGGRSTLGRSVLGLRDTPGISPISVDFDAGPIWVRHGKAAAGGWWLGRRRGLPSVSGIWFAL